MIKLPVIVVDKKGVDIGIYKEIKDVEQHLEAIHVKNDEYIAYDAEGRLLKLETDGRYIKVLATEEDPMHAAELEASLREYLIAVKDPLAKELTCDLPCLVNLATKYASVYSSLREIVNNLWHKLIKKTSI